MQSKQRCLSGRETILILILKILKTVISLQLRLDFVNFVITGPSTLTVSIIKSFFGSYSQFIATGGFPMALASNCLTDTFSVTGYSTSPPIICGKNTAGHSN